MGPVVGPLRQLSASFSTSGGNSTYLTELFWPLNGECIGYLAHSPPHCCFINNRPHFCVLSQEDLKIMQEGSRESSWKRRKLEEIEEVGVCEGEGGHLAVANDLGSGWRMNQPTKTLLRRLLLSWKSQPAVDLEGSLHIFKPEPELLGFGWWSMNFGECCKTALFIASTSWQHSPPILHDWFFKIPHLLHYGRVLQS